MITVRTLVTYLLGSGDAARRVASNPKALWIGLAFVFAAGFAREYDGEDLLRDPWHLALPVVASLITSLLLYVILRIAASPGTKGSEDGPTGKFMDGYPVLLRLYWWTAPLAFLYAIPVERMMGPGDATRANLWLLCLVATWRVLLITRAISAAWRTKFIAVLFPVMLFADGVALILLMVAPLPVFTLMGGVRLTESEIVIRETATMVTLLGLLSGPAWLVGTAVANRWLRKSGLATGAGVPESDGRISKPLIAVAALSILVWVPILPQTQPPQQRRRAVEEDLEAGRYAQAVERVQRHDRDAFPPHWDPPPRPGYGEHEPDPVEVLAHALESDAPYWFTESYCAKVPGVVGENVLYERRKFRSESERDHYERVQKSLTGYAHARRLASEHNEILRAIVERALGDAEMPPELLELLGESRD